MRKLTHPLTSEAVVHSMNLKLFLCTIALFFFYWTDGFSQLSVDQTLKDALHNTFNAQISRYTLNFSKKSFSSNDTINHKYAIIWSKHNDGFSYNCKINDSIEELYYERLLLYINNHELTYKYRHHDMDKILAQKDYIFRPLHDFSFSKIILDRSNNINLLHSSEQESVFLVVLRETPEIDSLSFTFHVSKNNDVITKYSMYAVVAGLENWMEWELPNQIHFNSQILSFEDTIASKFFNTLIEYTYKCPNSKSIENGSQNYNDSLDIVHNILPYLKLVDYRGNISRLADDRSDYYLVDYWYIACPPCIKSLPMLKSLTHNFNEKYFKIVSVNTKDKSMKLLESYIKHNEILYPVYVKSTDIKNVGLNVGAYPTFVLYDKEFNILKIFYGYNDGIKEEVLRILEQN